MSKLCKDCACENVCGITHTPDDKACEYYKPDAVTELEKTKEKILSYKKYKDFSCMGTVYDFEIENIFDIRIKELKGKKNER